MKFKIYIIGLRPHLKHYYFLKPKTVICINYINIDKNLFLYSFEDLY